VTLSSASRLSPLIAWYDPSAKHLTLQHGEDLSFFRPCTLFDSLGLPSSIRGYIVSARELPGRASGVRGPCSVKAPAAWHIILRDQLTIGVDHAAQIFGPLTVLLSTKPPPWLVGFWNGWGLFDIGSLTPLAQRYGRVEIVSKHVTLCSSARFPPNLPSLALLSGHQSRCLW